MALQVLIALSPRPRQRSQAVVAVECFGSHAFLLDSTKKSGANLVVPIKVRTFASQSKRLAVAEIAQLVERRIRNA